MKTKLLLVTVLMCAGLSVSAQDWAKARLEKSPRHGEWVDLKVDSRTLHCFIVFPEVRYQAPTVVVIHEIFGLTPWARNAADEVAAAGCIAIAPDLLSGAGPHGGGSSDFASTDDAVAAIQKLPPDQITSDLNAAAFYVRTLKVSNGDKPAVVGFCWGGGQAFRFACNQPDVKAAFVFYGPPPDKEEMKSIRCPVYGFYGENDARITLSIPDTEKLMKAAGKTYKPVTYDGAGHGFMRAGEQPDAGEANRKAHDNAWKRLKELLSKL